MWVKLDIITYEGIFILCYLETIQVVARLLRDWDTFDKVTQHHNPGFIVPSEAPGTLKFTLFVLGPDT